MKTIFSIVLFLLDVSNAFGYIRSGCQKLQRSPVSISHSKQRFLASTRVPTWEYAEPKFTGLQGVQFGLFSSVTSLLFDPLPAAAQDVSEAARVSPNYLILGSGLLSITASTLAVIYLFGGGTKESVFKVIGKQEKEKNVSWVGAMAQFGKKEAPPATNSDIVSAPSSAKIDQTPFPSAFSRAAVSSASSSMIMKEKTQRLKELKITPKPVIDEGDEPVVAKAEDPVVDISEEPVVDPVGMVEEPVVDKAEDPVLEAEETEEPSSSAEVNKETPELGLLEEDKFKGLKAEETEEPSSSAEVNKEPSVEEDALDPVAEKADESGTGVKRGSIPLEVAEGTEKAEGAKEAEAKARAEVERKVNKSKARLELEAELKDRREYEDDIAKRKGFLLSKRAAAKAGKAAGRILRKYDDTAVENYWNRKESMRGLPDVPDFLARPDARSAVVTMQDRVLVKQAFVEAARTTERTSSDVIAGGVLGKDACSACLLKMRQEASDDVTTGLHGVKCLRRADLDKAFEVVCGGERGIGFDQFVELYSQVQAGQVLGMSGWVVPRASRIPGRVLRRIYRRVRRIWRSASGDRS